MKNIESKFKEWTGADMIEGMGKDYVLIGFKGGYETAKSEYEAKLNECADKQLETAHKYLSVVEELVITKSKLKEAVEALKFYADPGHWGTDKPGLQTSIDPCDQVNFNDDYSNYGIRGGKKAREFLKSLEGGE